MFGKRKYRGEDGSIEGFVSAVVLCSLTVYTLFFPWIIKEEISRMKKEKDHRVINTAGLIADRLNDGNGVVSEGEWRKVYENAGLIYYPGRSNPLRDLSANLVTPFLKNNKDVFPERSGAREYIDQLF